MLKSPEPGPESNSWLPQYVYDKIYNRGMRGSTNFRQGGPGQSDKKSSDNVFCFCFFSPQLILQKSNGQFQRNL